MIKLNFKNHRIALFALFLLCSIFGVIDASVMCADTPSNLAPDTSGGDDGVGGHGGEGYTFEDPASVEDFFKKEIDPKLEKLEPYNMAMATIASKINNTKKISRQEYEYFTQGYLPTETELTGAIAADIAQSIITVSDPKNIAVNETLILEGIPGYLPGTDTPDPLRDLVLVVVDRDSTGAPICQAVNGKGSGNLIPAIALPSAGNDPVYIARSMRAASEKQIRTDVFSSLPQKRTQFLQKNLCEVEMSTFFEQGDKNVQFTFSDATERALLEYKRENNTGYWKGAKNKLQMSNKYRDVIEDTYFTEGVWYQPPTGNDFYFNNVSPTASSLIDLLEKVFSGPSSSDTKVAFCSTNVLSALQKVQWTNSIYLGERVDFLDFHMTRLISNFGELLLFHSKDMNECGLKNKMFVGDVNYLQKLTMGYRAIPLDNVKTGTADSKSYIITEPSALIYRVPESCYRVHL